MSNLKLVYLVITVVFVVFLYYRKLHSSSDKISVSGGISSDAVERSSVYTYTVLSNAVIPSTNSKFVTLLSEEVNWGLLTQTNVDTKIIINQIMKVMINFLMIEPLHSINNTCGPDIQDSLPITEQTCKDASTTAFSGLLRKTPSKIGIFIQLGFDIDTLEIHLFEVYDIVDFIFIIESTNTHYKGQKKPLLWQILSSTSRFKRFTNKVVGFVIDDADSLHNEGIWGLEGKQEQMRWDKFIVWNKYHKVFNGDDMLVFGDADEVPSRKNIRLLKHCVPNRTPIDIGIAFTMSHVDWLFKTDWPVSNSYPFALGDPSAFSLNDALKVKTPNRMRGRSRNFILGGIHLTDYMYLPFRWLKKNSCTECEQVNKENLVQWNEWVKNKDVASMEQWAHNEESGWNNRITNFNTITDEKQKQVRVIPWFLECNPKRFPAWWWLSDTRLY